MSSHTPTETDATRRTWLEVRRYLVANRHRLGVEAADEYPAARRVARTPLLAPPQWIPPEPIPLASVRLEFDPNAAFTGVTGLEIASRASLPLRSDGRHFNSYAEAIAELDRPSVFENRSTYRLISADLTDAQPTIRLGRGSYFDSINTGEASAHEYAAGRLGHRASAGIRTAIGDPCDATRRPINIAISTLTIRRDEATGEATFYLHWRDPAKVAHAAGLYQVVPSGVFQPSADASWNELHDFSLWRNLVRELAEELLAAGLDDGSVRAYCVGLGVDPLTFATDLLTILSIDSTLFDTLFGHLVDANDEGRVLARQLFTAETINDFVHHKPLQAAGAAILQLAWNHHLT
jgi:hypothetical protein